MEVAEDHWRTKIDRKIIAGRKNFATFWEKVSQYEVNRRHLETKEAFESDLEATRSAIEDENRSKNRSEGGRSSKVPRTRAGQKPHALVETTQDTQEDVASREAVEDDQKERLEDLEAVRNTRWAQKRSSTNALDEDKAKEAEVPLRELDRAKIRALRTQKRSAEEARLQEAGYINGKPTEVPLDTRRLYTGCW